MDMDLGSSREAFGTRTETAWIEHLRSLPSDNRPFAAIETAPTIAFPPASPPHKKKKEDPMCCACGSKNDLQEPSAACTHLYCMGCLVGMFRFAVKDRSSFPVHCCGLIQLHTVLPTLDESAAKAYRAIWDEWMTAKKVYCPERSCSVFIPPRLIPHSVDADTAPADISFPCPTCKTGICAKCCRLVHRGEPCGEAENDYELALLATFGYKPCPRCGEGVKRMFGCRHVKCRCGADLCWKCMRFLGDCSEGTCPGNEGDEADQDCQNAEDQEDEEEEEEESADVVLGNAETDADGSDDVLAERGLHDRTEKAATPLPVNLDAGTQAQWQDSGLDFGDEPGGAPSQGLWSCEHDFARHDKGRVVRLRYVECNLCFRTCPYGKSARFCRICCLVACKWCKTEFETGLDDSSEDEEKLEEEHRDHHEEGKGGSFTEV
ncbi:unnamed protein product [Zymoseptoria tritici ST99CH_3D7]|uniref:RING-type domain-containing protein n=2 Tax=Zymoseptoria tritici TaxID=1047171 RepID=A0A1X7RTQ1_ZYMT9|nr:unnamed protein product [Zymoseptoria tritici ST99CH_3D7]SMR52499.1 unnamed protein product [Zymoseptoria tritici ST99CH_1E4]